MPNTIFSSPHSKLLSQPQNKLQPLQFVHPIKFSLACFQGKKEDVINMANENSTILDVVTDTKYPYFFVGSRALSKEVQMTPSQRKSSVDFGFSPLYSACLNNHYEIVFLLIEKGCNVNLPSGSIKNTPLFAACDKGNLELVKLLVEKGGNLEFKNIDGSTPLHRACQNGYLDIVKFILEKDENLFYIENKRGESPFSILKMKRIHHREIDLFLLPYTAKVEQDKEIPIKGQLTIHGVSKEVILNTTYNGIAKNLWDKFVLFFSSC